MRRVWLAVILAVFVGSSLSLASLVVGDLSRPEYWGVVGHRDPRLYLPFLAALACVALLSFLRAWLRGRPRRGVSHSTTTRSC